MAKTESESKTYTEAETESRREAALQVMFKTPHKPHKTTAKPKLRRGNSGKKGKQG